MLIVWQATKSKLVQNLWIRWTGIFRRCPRSNEKVLLAQGLVAVATHLAPLPTRSPADVAPILKRRYP